MQRMKWLLATEAQTSTSEVLIVAIAEALGAPRSGSEVRVIGRYVRGMGVVRGRIKFP